MKRFENNITHSARKALQQAENERFHNQLEGFGAIIGAPHWQFGSAIGRETTSYYIERGHALRSLAISQTAGAIFRGLLDRARATGKAYSAWRKHRKNVRALYQLSERTLKDIGLTHADIYGIASRQISVDDLYRQRKPSHAGVSKEAAWRDREQLSDIAACNDSLHRVAA